MAVVNDWVFDASLEISARVQDTHPFHGVHIGAIILAHCPFKQDTAYMPVPRCETCKHWEQQKENRGICAYAREGYDRKIWAELYDDVLTEADFGCVQWEAK